jgi:hypothetical protein
VVHPEASGSMMAMSRFLTHFDPATSAYVKWQPVNDGDQIPLDGRRFLRAYATRHIPASEPGRPRSLGYQVVRIVDRVRPELRGLPQSELDSMRQSGGRESITQPVEEILLTVSGDTKVMPAATVRGTRFLLHECTFLDSDHDRLNEARERGHDHACLNEVLMMAKEAEVQHLALYHVSKRYTDEEILRSVRADCSRLEIRFRVSVALPGRLYNDLFSQVVWRGERELD